MTWLSKPHGVRHLASTRRFLAVVVALAALASEPAAAADWPFQPVPIGAAPEYRPPARWPAAGWGAFGGFQGGVSEGARAHLELFANQRVIVVPAGIGVSGGRTTLYGNVVDALSHARTWTLEPGGVVHLDDADVTLGDVFATWGQPLEPGRLLTFSRPIRAWVNGEPHEGDPRSIALHDGDQVVLVLGGDVDVHRSFAFKPVRL
jgi:hypothetical protein